jgi:hypothetical protein
MSLQTQRTRPRLHGGWRCQITGGCLPVNVRHRIQVLILSCAESRGSSRRKKATTLARDTAAGQPQNSLLQDPSTCRLSWSDGSVCPWEHVPDPVCLFCSYYIACVVVAGRRSEEESALSYSMFVSQMSWAFRTSASKAWCERGSTAKACHC